MRLVIAFALAVGALGCADASTLELVLVHGDAFDPELDFTTAEVIVIGLGDEDIEGDEVVALQWSGTAAELLAGVPLPEVAGLVEGDGHFAGVLFGTTAGCVASTRVVGRSMLFEHRADGDRVTVAVGCAEEFQPTRGMPLSRRIGLGLAATLDGRAIVAGGAERLDPGSAPIFWQDEVRGIEVYDARTGRFTESGELSVGRVAPAVVRLNSGEVAAIGGVSVETPACNATQEIAWPAPRDGLAELDAPRCAPSAAIIESGQVIVHGGRSDEATLATFDENLSTLVDAGALTMSPTRLSPQLIPLGNAALAIGGDGFDEPRAELLLPECGGTGEACALPLPIDPADDPGPGWIGMTGAVVGCIEGGDVATGALYVTGGGVRPAPGVEPDVILDTVFCTLITADLPAWELRAIGTLPAPRRGHKTIVVSDGSGATDLLLVGGTGAAGSLDDSVLLEARGCTCTIANARSVPMPGAPSLTLHDATTLSDGSILVLGGGRLNLVDGTFDATAWAGVYYPDVLP